MKGLEENQKVIQLTLQDAQNNDKKKQQHEKMVNGKSSSSRCKTTMHHGQSARKSSLNRHFAVQKYPPIQRTVESRSQQLILERVRWDFVLAKLKYEHEDNEKQWLHEERMEQIHQQAVKRSVIYSQGLQDVLQPLNQYALFLYCFIVIHVIYTVKDLAIYFSQTHYLFCFAVVLSYILKKIFQYCKSRKGSILYSFCPCFCCFSIFSSLH
uniref:Uncharacterized protein n=1 Tax=Otus sunia TaxID=257818 RepID=A0A8C8B9Y5_9STRI